MKVAIFDIDGTLADNTHRQHHLAGETKDWDAFYAEMNDDTEHAPVAELARRLASTSLSLVMVTGRPQQYYYATQRWLAAHGLTPHALYMRADGDHRPDHKVKREILQTIRAVGFEPLLVVDDRTSVVKMWREEGLTCLQCSEGDF